MEEGSFLGVIIEIEVAVSMRNGSDSANLQKSIYESGYSCSGKGSPEMTFP
jgi:hypothetical protein